MARSQLRCLPTAPMNAWTSRTTAQSARSSVGTPAAFATCSPAPGEEDRLAVTVLVPEELARLPQRRERRGAPSPRPGPRRRRRAPTASSRACRRAPRCPRRRSRWRRAGAPTSRTTASASVRAFCAVATESPSTPGATRIAIRRPRMLPSPGRAVRESAGDRLTSGVGGSIDPRHGPRQLQPQAVGDRLRQLVRDVPEHRPPCARGSRAPGPWSARSGRRG